MPSYYSPSGLKCTADEALSGGKLRAGYSEILSDGEGVRFDLALRDSAPTHSSRSVYLTDNPPPAYSMDHGRALAEARLAQAAHDASATALNAWRGGVYAADHAVATADVMSARAAVDVLRHARHQG